MSPPLTFLVAPPWGGRHPRLAPLALAFAVVAAALTSAAEPASGAFVEVVVTGDANAVAGAVERLGGTVVRSLPLVDGVTARVPRPSVAALAGLPGIRSVTPNLRVAVQGRYGEGSGMASAVYSDTVRAPKAWAAGWDGEGTGVAVVDTGIATGGDLAGQVRAAVDFTAEGDGIDRYGHGTFVAGLIAGTGLSSAGAVRGVAPGAHLVSVKVAGQDGSTDLVTVLAGLQWVVDHRDDYDIHVLNLSLGVSSAEDYRTNPLNIAVERVWNAGIVVVAAAGNDGALPGTITKPGDDPLVVTAGASDDRTTVAVNDDTLAAFSGAGPTASNGVAKPDVVAPGTSVVSVRAPGSTIDAAVPSARIGEHYFKGSGTSFSAALVSGAAAVVLSRDPSLTPNQIKRRLAAGARTMPGLDPLSVGGGELDVWSAVASDSLVEANQGVAPSAGGLDLGSELLWEGSKWQGSKWQGSKWQGSKWQAALWE